MVRKQAINDTIAGGPGIPFVKASRLEQPLQVAQHRRTAARHHPVVGQVERGHAQVLEQLAASISSVIRPMCTSSSRVTLS